MNDDDRNRDSEPQRPDSDGPHGRARSSGQGPPEDARAPAAGPDPGAEGQVAGAQDSTAGRSEPAAGEPNPADGGPAEPPQEDPSTQAPADRAPRTPAPSTPRTGRQRLAAGLWPPRLSRSQLIVAVLLLGLGLGLTIQVRSTNEHSVLRGARQEDLVRILSELDSRTQRLEEEKRTLENQRTELENSSDQAEEARKQTERRERQLGVLAGTIPARGPGVTLTVTDSSGTVEADMLLDAIQELRAAGAEALQINSVRVVAESYLADSDSGVRIDGHQVESPYRFTAIGDPDDLEPALNIPGGVVQTLQREQATVSVEGFEEVLVDAVRPAERPEHARSSS